MKKILILLIILLTSCKMPIKPTVYDMIKYQTEYNEELFKLGNRGIVMFEIYNNFGEAVFKINKNSPTKTLFSTIDFVINNNYAILMLPEGEYTLNDFSLLKYITVYYQLADGTTASSTKVETFPLKDLLKPVKFTVKRNEVMYLGRLDIITKEENVKKETVEGSFFKKLFNSVEKERKVLYRITDNLNTEKKDKLKKIINKNIKVELMKFAEEK